MHHATSLNPRQIALAASTARYKTRFMVTVTLGAHYLLYGSETSCHDALIEAVADHPLAQHYNDIEYLPPDVLRQIAAGQVPDPRAEALSHMGRVNPHTDKPVN